MNTPDYYDTHDAVGLAELVRAGELTAQELVEEAIDRIERLNPQLNAITHKRYDYAHELARSVSPDASALAGVPFVLKDLAIEWEGFPVTNSCAYLKDQIATSDWEVARRLRTAGLIPLGKTNVPENGWCAATEPALYGPTRNPWNAGRVTGGSSGGSSVAVASGMVPIADASDGGGSIRLPAAINGLVGLKPSRGRVTLGPDLVDFWYGAAVFHCVARTVRDSGAYLDVIGGAVAGEPYALAMPQTSYLEAANLPPSRLKIGVNARLPDGAELPTEVGAAVQQAVEVCEANGHDIETTSLRYDLETTRGFFARITAVASASGFAAAASRVGHEVGPDDVEPITWELIQFGRRFSAIEHANDIERMRIFGRQVVQDLSAFDVVISPVMPTTTRPVGWYDMGSSDLEAYSDLLFDDMVFTLPFNISGQPALTFPMVTGDDGCPIGVQLAGRIGDEATLLSLGSQFEEARPWNDRRLAEVRA